MKRLLSLLIVLVLFLSACGGTSVPAELEVPEVSVQTEEDVQSVLEAISDTAEVQVQPVEEEEESSSSSAPAKAESTAPAASSSAPTAASSSSSAALEKESDTALKPSSDTFDGEIGEVEDAVGKVTVSIDCSKAIGESSKADSSGYFLQPTEVEIAADETAFDATLRICAAEGIAIDYRSSRYGMYVSAIADLAEKECGAMSGWVFYVNGEWSTVAASEYELQPGDEIEWVYVTTYTGM